MEERPMKILVATDGSRAGVAAVKFAAKLAGADRGSRVIVLTVDSNGSSGRPGPAGTGAQKVLEAAARQMGTGRRQSRFQAVPARGVEVPEVISREADRCHADMVVVGSEGRDSLDEWVVGGTALRLIYVARRPVTVVRAPRRRKAS
jgi:nucleotide-binding universal stress UspA family protein